MAEKKDLIVIIGNGFDLAHNMPTSYIDFSDWILKDITREQFQEDVNFEKTKELLNSKFLQELKEYKKRRTFVNPGPRQYLIADFAKGNEKEVVWALKKTPSLFSIFIQSEFLLNLYKQRELNWFNVEKEYFKLLYYYTIHKKTKHSINEPKSVKRLNSDFDWMKLKLRQYLKTIKPKSNKKVAEFMEMNFQRYDSVIIVDFNYTETIKTYDISVNFRNVSHIINIHGTLKYEDEVFGFGNDQSDKYHELKALENDSVLQNFKTFKYLRNARYGNVMNAVDNGDLYDVFILGHSLGLTDKTLLQEIMDSPTCSEIYLFKRADLQSNQVKQMEEYDKLTMALARIMDNEKDLRRRVSNFDDSAVFPNL